MGFWETINRSDWKSQLCTLFCSLACRSIFQILFQLSHIYLTFRYLAIFVTVIISAFGMTYVENIWRNPSFGERVYSRNVDIMPAQLWFVFLRLDYFCHLQNLSDQFEVW